MTDKNKDVIIHNCQRAGQENDGIVCLMIEVRALHGVTFFFKNITYQNISIQKLGFMISVKESKR